MTPKYRCQGKKSQWLGPEIIRRKIVYPRVYQKYVGGIRLHKLKGQIDFQTQVRGASPQLECWNNGIMGSGIMQCWVNGGVCVDDKIKMANILLKTNLPVFHYSIIPYSRQAFKSQKMSYIFIKL